MYQKSKRSSNYTKFNQPSKLNTLEKFCASEHIFFSEKDRVDYSLQKSSNVYKEFRDSLNNGFKNLKQFQENPAFDYLMTYEVDVDKVMKSNDPFAIPAPAKQAVV